MTFRTGWPRGVRPPSPLWTIAPVHQYKDSQTIERGTLASTSGPSRRLNPGWEKVPSMRTFPSPSIVRDIFSVPEDQSREEIQNSHLISESTSLKSPFLRSILAFIISGDFVRLRILLTLRALFRCLHNLASRDRQRGWCTCTKGSRFTLAFPADFGDCFGALAPRSRLTVAWSTPSALAVARCVACNSSRRLVSFFLRSTAILN